jgi:signal peptidase
MDRKDANVTFEREEAAEAAVSSKKKKTVGARITGAISTILVVIVVIIALLLVGVRLIGLKPFTVLSGAMEPTYHTGALIYVKSVDPMTIEAGTPITFMLDENTIATHRVVGVVPDEEDPTVVRFRTKGDANENEDGTLVHCKNVIGVPKFSIPYLGYLANYIQNPPGKYIAIAVIVVILLLAFVPDLFDDSKKGKKQKGVVSDKSEDESSQQGAEESVGQSAEDDSAENP